MQETIKDQMLKRLEADYGMKDRGGFLREGKCPSCSKKELWIGKEHPWTLRCGRVEKCGYEASTKDIYSDLFESWSDRYVQTDENPHAAAHAYLNEARGLNTFKLKGAYTQETYRCNKTNQTSATVRFALPGGDWWERIIDRPHRFGKKKANFPYGVSYRGRVWYHPDETPESLSEAEELWFAEGIFDTASLSEAFTKLRLGARAVSTLSTNNYPDAFLRKVAEAVSKRGPDARRPKLIWAFDVGSAGVRYAREYYKRALSEGWESAAAQVTPDGEGEKRDWNDLWLAKQIDEAAIETWLENGAITLAETAAEKASLLFKRTRAPSFPFTFRTRQMWATFDQGAMTKRMEELAELPQYRDTDPLDLMDIAAADAVDISELAECTWRALYFERDLALDQSSYYLRIDFPSAQPTIKASFPPGALIKADKFAERLIGVAPGAVFQGATPQLVRIMKTQTRGIRTVEALHFTGYSIDHKAYILGDIAVHAGKVLDKNQDDYFQIDKLGLKLRSPERTFKINWEDGVKPDVAFAWFQDLHTAYGAKGLVALSFWFMALFAEQIRAAQSSLGFLEMTGKPGTGKSTLIMFMWKLLGRGDGYEGFDPAKATAAAIARNLAKFGNLPVVMMEGDRTQESHAKKFDWDELKTLYNGHSTRSRGVSSGGLETYEPRFRGALVISQNRQIDADSAVMERIMAMDFDKTGWNADTKAAAERMERTEAEDVSGWIIAMLRQEGAIMDLFPERKKHHEDRLLTNPEVRNQRLAKCHAQLAAALDCLFKAMPVITKGQLAEGHALIERMCVDRHGSIDADHPAVQQFWENFDYFESKASASEGNLLNHSRKTDTIAVNLSEFEARSAAMKIRLPAENMVELKKLLLTSKARKFIKQGTVNSWTGRSVHCWSFVAPEPEKQTFELEGF